MQQKLQQCYITSKMQIKHDVFIIKIPLNIKHQIQRIVWTCWKEVCWKRFWRWGIKSDAWKLLLTVSLGGILEGCHIKHQSINNITQTLAEHAQVLKVKLKTEVDGDSA